MKWATVVVVVAGMEEAGREEVAGKEEAGREVAEG